MSKEMPDPKELSEAFERAQRQVEELSEKIDSVVRPLLSFYPGEFVLSIMLARAAQIERGMLAAKLHTPVYAVQLWTQAMLDGIDVNPNMPVPKVIQPYLGEEGKGN